MGIEFFKKGDYGYKRVYCDSDLTLLCRCRCQLCSPRRRHVAGDRSAAYRLFCTGGDDEDESDDEEKNEKTEKTEKHDSATVIFFRDILGGALSPGLVKIGLLVVYVVYLAVALWGIAEIGEGLQMKRLMADDSPASRFMDAEGDNFNVYGPTMQVAVDTELEIWKQTEIDKLNALLDRFQQGDALKHFYRYSAV